MRTYDDVVDSLGDFVEYHQHRYSRALDHVVARDIRWLDIGAGDQIHQGWIGATIADLASRAELIVGCDFVREHLMDNQALTDAVVADGCRLPFANSTFGLVTANMVLEHVASPEHLFHEVARVLRPGGHFVFVTPHLNHPGVRIASVLLSRGMRRLLARIVERRADDDIFPTHYRANTIKALRRYANDAGLSVSELEVFSSIPLMRRPVFATRIEAVWIRAMRAARLNQFGSNLLGVMRRPGDLRHGSRHT